MAQQTYFLHTLIDEIVRTKGAALAGQIPPPTRESLEAEFTAAALRAATCELGDATPIEIHIDSVSGCINVFQVVTVVETVADPDREIPLRAIRQVGSAYANIEVGEKILFPIHYTAAQSELEASAANETRLGAFLPLPVHSAKLWERLSDELTKALLRYFPGPVFRDGSLGAMLASGGDWTRGLAARSGNSDLEIVLESAFIDYYPMQIHPGLGRFEYGFVTVFRTAGREIYRGEPTTPVQWIGEGDQARCFFPIRHWDNEANANSWIGLPTSEAARPRVLAALQGVVDSFGQISERGAVEALLMAAVWPPVQRGLLG